MSECAVSTVTIPTSRAVELAQRKYEWILKQREKDEKHALDMLVTERNSWWFRRLFRMKPLSREQVLADEEAREWFPIGEIAWARVRYEETKNLCLRVMNAAAYSSEVTLSLEDLGRIT